MDSLILVPTTELSHSSPISLSQPFAQPQTDGRKVRVAMDGSLAYRPTTGISLYARCLGSALNQVGAQVETWSPPRGASGTLFMLGEVQQKLHRLKPDIFHAVCNFNLPLVRSRPTRFVLTVHDLIPLLLPETVSRAFRWQFKLWLTRSLQVADAVICVSETTRRSLLEHFSPQVPVHVIHHGVNHVDTVPAPDTVSTRWLDALNLGDFILYAGALDARKNVGLVVEAARKLGVTLAIVGQRWFGSADIERQISAAKSQGADIRLLGYLPDALFYALMRRARAFVFPSRYEGFGLPPLEAMRLKVPTIVSTAGALTEVCGDGALAVDADDVDALVQALQNADATLAERGYRRASQFDWETTARCTLDVYRSIL